MKIGYCRVSTDGQLLDLQKDALIQAGCDEKYIFEDKVSGAKWERAGLDKCLEQLRAKDTLVVWRLDRLGRSLKQMIEIVNYLKEQKIQFQSLTEGFDTSTSGGTLIFQIFGALAEFERNLIVERTHAGLEAAKARGRLGGRPSKLDKKKKELLMDLYNGGKHTIPEICELVGISKATLYRQIKKN